MRRCCCGECRTGHELIAYGMYCLCKLTPDERRERLREAERTMRKRWSDREKLRAMRQCHGPETTERQRRIARLKTSPEERDFLEFYSRAINRLYAPSSQAAVVRNNVSQKVKSLVVGRMKP